MRFAIARLETSWYNPLTETGLAPHCTVTHLATKQTEGSLKRSMSHREGDWEGGKMGRFWSRFFFVSPKSGMQQVTSFHIGLVLKANM